MADRIIEATVRSLPVTASSDPQETRKRFDCSRDSDALMLSCISAAGCADEIPVDLRIGEQVILVERAPGQLVGSPPPESWVFIKGVKRQPKKAV